MSNEKHPSDPKGGDDQRGGDEPGEPVEPGEKKPAEAVRPPDGDRVRPAHDGRRGPRSLVRKIKGYVN